MDKSYGTIVTADPKDLEEITRSLHELNTQSDRAAAIVGAAILDIALTHALKRYLHDWPKVTKRLFSINGAVGNLGPKIDLALLIGLVGEDAYNDLVIVKEIRNKFAHGLDVSDFKSDPIAALSNKLKIADIRTFDGKEPKNGCWIGVSNREAILADPRERFLLNVHVLIYGLSIPGKTATPSAAF